MSLIDRTKYTFGKSLDQLTTEMLIWRGDNTIFNCINLIAVLCVEILFPSSAENGTISLLDEVLRSFYFDNVEEVKKAIPGSDVSGVHAYGEGLHISLEMGQNIPKLFYYVALLLRIVAKKYQRLQEPVRAKNAAVTAALYIQACTDLLDQRKEIAIAQLNVSLPILLFDQGPVPDKYDKYVFNIDAAVEREFELTERNIERLRYKIKTLIAELSENEEGKK